MHSYREFASNETHKSHMANAKHYEQKGNILWNENGLLWSMWPCTCFNVCHPELNSNETDENDVQCTQLMRQTLGWRSNARKQSTTDTGLRRWHSHRQLKSKQFSSERIDPLQCIQHWMEQCLIDVMNRKMPLARCASITNWIDMMVTKAFSRTRNLISPECYDSGGAYLIGGKLKTQLIQCNALQSGNSFKRNETKWSIQRNIGRNQNLSWWWKSIPTV
jgi:hypothetical protein